jgi:hypothetical protein
MKNAELWYNEGMFWGKLRHPWPPTPIEVIDGTFEWREQLCIDGR